VNSIVTLVGAVKMKFILTFLCCKKIIHIFFDLYEGIWRNQKLVILSFIEYNNIFNYQIFNKERQYLFLNNDQILENKICVLIHYCYFSKVSIRICKMYLFKPSSTTFFKKVF
jgi:hypothetical protein